MQRLMDERNDKLLEIVLTATTNAQAERDMMQVHNDCVKKIVEAARSAKDPEKKLRAAMSSGDIGQLRAAIEVAGLLALMRRSSRKPSRS